MRTDRHTVRLSSFDLPGRPQFTHNPIAQIADRRWIETSPVDG